MNLEQPTKNNSESSTESRVEDLDISKLNFEQLQEARELGEKSFQRTEKGFMMVDGKELFFKEMGGDTYALMNAESVDGLPVYMVNNDSSILNVSRNEGMKKEVLTEELERVLVSEEFGYRIIE